MSEIRDISLKSSGKQKIDWAWRYMPLLNGIWETFLRDQPFQGMKISASLHLEAKSACLCRVLAAGGADLRVTGCNPLSTQDDVVAAMADEGLDVYAWYDCTREEYDRHLRSALGHGPDILIDDGGDLTSMVHREMPELIPAIRGGCEETTTGIIRLYAMEREGALRFPMIDVNDAQCKHLFDNRYGTGQSVWDGIIRSTNLLIAGKQVVVAGYGWCGRGIAMRAKGMGANVIVTEVNPVKALEAKMDGYAVMTMDEAAPLGDFFVTATGCCGVITGRHFEKIRDGAILCNGGHFNVEIDMAWLESNAEDAGYGRSKVTKGYRLPNGRTIFVPGEGRLVNLATGDGHPVEIMDMSFAIQALSARYVAERGRSLEPRVIGVPEEIDREVAFRRLKASGIAIDTLTAEQVRYLNSWAV